MVLEPGPVIMKIIFTIYTKFCEKFMETRVKLCVQELSVNEFLGGHAKKHSLKNQQCPVHTAHGLFGWLVILYFRRSYRLAKIDCFIYSHDHIQIR